MVGWGFEELVSSVAKKFSKHFTELVEASSRAHGRYAQMGRGAGPSSCSAPAKWCTAQRTCTAPINVRGRLRTILAICARKKVAKVEEEMHILHNVDH